MSQNPTIAVQNVDDTRVTKSFRVRESLWDKVKAQAANDKRTLSATVEIVLEKWLENERAA